MLRKRVIALILLFVCLPAVQAQDDRVTVIPIPSVMFGYTLSPDGRLAAVFENGVLQNDTVYPEYLPVRVYDLAAGEEIAALTGQTDYASDAAFSPDGKLLVSFHTNGYLYVWDTASWELLRRIPTSPGGGLLRFLPDSRHLTGRIAGQPGAIAVWDIETGAMTALLTPRYDSWQEHKEAEFSRPGGPNPMAAFEPAPDGEQVLVVMSTGEFRLWDITTSQSQVWRAVEETRAMFPVRELDYSADGTRLGYFDRTASQMVVVDAMSGAEIATFDTGEDARSGALSPDGDTAAWLAGASVFVAPVEQPNAVTEIPLETELETKGQLDLEFLPDSAGLVVGGLVSFETENALFVVKLEE